MQQRRLGRLTLVLALDVNMTGYDEPTREGVRIMTAAWPPEAMQRIVRAEELEIAARRADGTLRRRVPVWVVGVGGRIYVRTWHRRDTGWFGQVVDSRRARIRVPDLEADVAVADIGERDADLRADVDAAYRTKYGHYGATSLDRMLTDDAAAATLRLVPE
jgi:hypothetical protein